MLTNVNELFELLLIRLTAEDIRDFSPSDPGYNEYVGLWSNILLKGTVENKISFQHSEVISLTGYSDPALYAAPDRFLTYRLFTLAVACHMLAEGNGSDTVWPVNYTAIRLIDDAHRLQDVQTLAIMGDLLSELAAKLKSLPHPEEEYLFLYLAEMIWAQRQGDFTRSAAASTKLLREEQEVRHLPGYSFDDSRFLFGITNYEHFDNEWSQAISELTNPDADEDLGLVVETLQQYSSP